MTHLLKALISASEKAANVARSCCDGPLEERALVVSEKCDDANPRFDQDFKTIADVLAQQAARSKLVDLCKEFRGEECSDINGVSITIKPSIDETSALLSQIVPSAVALTMAEAAHKEPEVNVDLADNIPCIVPEDIGIWMDPIDGTNEFINGVKSPTISEDKGLSCVTVLIGAYSMTTGEPIAGVINAPFAKNGKGQIVWGVNYQGYRDCGGFEKEKNTSHVVLMSGAEKPELKDKFKKNEWNIQSVPGAGNKLLKVVLGESPLYIVSQGTTFRWDTCGPHAILKSMGGDLIAYKTKEPIKYNDPKYEDSQMYCNSDGIIAFSDQVTLKKLDDVIRQN